MFYTLNIVLKKNGFVKSFIEKSYFFCVNFFSSAGVAPGSVAGAVLPIGSVPVALLLSSIIKSFPFYARRHIPFKARQHIPLNARRR